MKNKYFQKNIINSIYRYEARRTSLTIIKYTFLILLFLFISLFTLFAIISIFQQAYTFDLLGLFNEDFEIIKDNFKDVVFVFYEEMPKTLMFLLFITLLLFSVVLYFLIKNFSKIKNRMISLRKYFK